MSEYSRTGKETLAEYRRKRDFGRTPEPPGKEGPREPDHACLAAAVPGAVPAELPSYIPPQLAASADAPVPGNDWLHEIKYRGYRVLCRIDHGNVRCFSRKGNTLSLPPIAAAMARLPVTRAWFDGEIVVLRPDGTASFSALQSALRTATCTSITYLVFDIMYLDGFDLRAVSLQERKRLLAALVPESDTVRYADHVTGRGDEFYFEACAHSVEGVVSKRVDAPYRSGKSLSWLKLRCGKVR